MTTAFLSTTAASRRLVTKIAQSEGANAALLVPSVGRGFSTNEDGSTTVFALRGYGVIKRVKFAKDADAAVFDPVTGQVALLSGDSKLITLLDPSSLAITGRIAMPSNKLEGAAPDGEGGIFVAERDRAMVVHVSLKSRSITAEWPTTGCAQPTGLAFDSAHQRLFLGCRGAAPVLAVMDSKSGRVVATPAIGRGNDGVAYDAGRGRDLRPTGSIPISLFSIRITRIITGSNKPSRPDQVQGRLRSMRLAIGYSRSPPRAS